MGVGSGLGGSFGLAKETTYGTYAAPSRHLRVSKATVKKTKEIVQGGGLAAGAPAQPGSMRAIVSTAGEGEFELEVTTKKFGLLLEQIFGGTVAPAQIGATTAYQQDHPLVVDNLGKSLTVQNGVPNTAGTVVPFTGTGAKVVSAEFTCERGGFLTVSVELDLRGEVETFTLAAPSFVANQLGFTFKDLAVRLGATPGAVASVDGVKKVSFKVERGMDVERYYAGANGMKAEPIVNEWLKVSGSIDADFLDKTVFVDRFSNDTPTSLSLLWSSQQLAAPGNPFSLELAASQVFFDTDQPELEGPDIVSGSFNFTAQYDETNPLASAKYVSTDVTV